jgi:hypothetical protein
MPTIRIERKDGSFQIINSKSDLAEVNPHDIAHDVTQGNYRGCTITGKPRKKKNGKR